MCRTQARARESPKQNRGVIQNSKGVSRSEVRIGESGISGKLYHRGERRKGQNLVKEGVLSGVCAKDPFSSFSLCDVRVWDTPPPPPSVSPPLEGRGRGKNWWEILEGGQRCQMRETIRLRTEYSIR